MRRLLCCLALAVCVSPITALAGENQPDDPSLRAADAEELRIIQTRDTKAMQEFMLPNYMVNSPANRITRKDQLIQMLSAGQIANEGIERTIEALAITGNVGIVMGREVIKPKATSELGQLYGAKALERRFTNVFLFVDGKWRLLARQSTVTRAAP